MIYVFLQSKKSTTIVDEKTQRLIQFIRDNIKYNNFNYTLKFKTYLIDSDIEDIDSDSVVFFDPIVASKNLTMLKNFKYSIVILDKPSLLQQKLSDLNPINENLAINNGFLLTYIDSNNNDISNDEWKLVIESNSYLLSIEDILQIIALDSSNVKQEKVEVPNIFESITDLVKQNQINLD
jgi:hypothetical protein